MAVMKIVFVLECANAVTNGTAATCYRFAKELQNRGHEIVMLGQELAPGQTSPFTYIGLKHFKFPSSSNATSAKSIRPSKALTSFTYSSPSSCPRRPA